jgi:hypothetical protein
MTTDPRRLLEEDGDRLPAEKSCGALGSPKPAVVDPVVSVTIISAFADGCACPGDPPLPVRAGRWDQEIEAPGS